ncbi:ATP-binding protein [Desulfatitalea tepidiphila]|uniref:ATP-binding protein n=1 Tax=Desulfatitalea tepidiphila TaxID=1185843 RepID=UPI000A6FCB13|nr:ATP-binding protein [Desulfatitalea tepidiphila]
MDKEAVLLIDSDGQAADALHSILHGWGHPVDIHPDVPSALNRFDQTQPPFVLVNTDLPGGVRLAVDIRSVSSDAIIFAMASDDRLPDMMRRLKDWADEFLRHPVDALALDIALQRSRKIRRLIHDVKHTCGQDRSAQTCDNVAREVANERFLVVRQIIEKMSSFIAQVASTVEGGVKYFNELPYFVSVHSPDCRVLAANETSLKFFGNRLYANSWEIYIGKRATREACPVGRTVRSGNVETTPALVQYKSGSKVPVLVHTAPVYDNDGEVALVLEVFAGTQEIDQLAEQVRSTQQRYEKLFDAVPVQVVVLDRRHNITAANRRFKELFGDQIGRKFFDTFRPAAFPAFRDPISLTLGDGLPHQGEMSLTGPDHHNYTVMAHTSPIMTASGKLVQVLAILTDITQFRQMKDHMATLGLMLSTVCHDMKGCITGLDAGLYLVDKGFYRNAPGRIEEGLDVIRMMGDRLRKLVFGVLYDAKERPMEIETVEVQKFVGDIAAVFETHIRGAAIEFICDFEGCDGDMQVDPGLLRSALSNLLENAVEACIEEDLKPDHRIDFIAGSGEDEVVFEIRDNGRGIPEEQLKHLFNLFHSSKGQRGTGLGLYITEKAVLKHGGRIDVSSTPGKGTAFSVHLPRRFAGTSGDRTEA